jgi:hypothetical protein
MKSHKHVTHVTHAYFISLLLIFTGLSSQAGAGAPPTRCVATAVANKYTCSPLTPQQQDLWQFRIENQSSRDIRLYVALIGTMTKKTVPVGPIAIPAKSNITKFFCPTSFKEQSTIGALAIDQTTDNYWARIYQVCSQDYKNILTASGQQYIAVCGFWPTPDEFAKKEVKIVQPLILNEKNVVGKDINMLKVVIPQDPDPHQCQATVWSEHDMNGVWHDL